ncbi:MAG: beta-xylosidase, partial [Bacteroidota bacterium]
MTNRQFLFRFLFVSFLVIVINNLSAQSDKPVPIIVDVSVKEGVANKRWAYFGYDEPNYTYMKDGKKLLGEIAALSPYPVYVRTHNLLTTGDGTADLKWG